MPRPRLFVVPAALAVALACAFLMPGNGRGESAAIFLDGTFADWTGPIEHVDPSGDGGTGADFREVDLANDDDWLFVRFQTTRELGIQATGNNLFLYLDTDMNAATGLAIGGIGAELQWSFGGKTGCFQPPGSGTCGTIAQHGIRLRMLPSITASTFEIAISRGALPNGVNPLFNGPGFRLVLRDAVGGDLAPNAGGLTYTFDATPVPAPTPMPFARLDPLDVRVTTWNVVSWQNGAGFNAPVTQALDRVLSAIAPDILCFQEIYTPTGEAVRLQIESILPERSPWYAAKQNDAVVVSRYPIAQSWPLDGNIAVLLNTNAALDANTLLVCAHLPCCQNETARQAECDRIASFFRDAKTPGGVVDVPTGTHFVIAGDLNLVGFAQQLQTLLAGDIVDNVTFGPDFTPDWDGTSLADVISSQTERRFAWTWHNDAGAFAPGRLDYVIYSDSGLRGRHHYSVFTPEMSAAQLAATGIMAGDGTTVSDHLPHVADFRSVADVVAVGGLPGGHGPRLLGEGVGRGEIRLALELGYEAEVEIDVYDAQGRHIRSWFGAGSRLGVGRHVLAWDGQTSGGQATGSGVYYLKVIARPMTGGPPAFAAGRCVLLR